MAGLMVRIKRQKLKFDTPETFSYCFEKHIQPFNLGDIWGFI